VNFDRRFQRVRPALAPPGSARTDLAILQALASALGADLGPTSAAEVLAECARVAPLYGGVSHDRLDREGPLHWPCRTADDPGEPQLYLDGFATPSGRAELAAVEWLPPGEEPDAEYPFTLITGRRLAHYNSGSMTRRTANLTLDAEERLDIHPDDASRLGIAEGDPVHISSRRGSVRARTHRCDTVAPGEVFMSFHFPEAPVNRLTSDRVDEATSCPEYKVTAVRLRPVTGS
jgi:formate dehydrogenase major subunit